MGKKIYIPENQIGLFEFLNQQEQQEKLDQLEQLEIEDEFIESKDCYFGYENGPEYSILIHDYQFKKKKQHSYEVHNHIGFIYVEKHKIQIDIGYATPPAPNRHCLTLYDMNQLPLPNCKYHYEVHHFKNLEDTIKYIKSDFKDKSLILEQNYEEDEEGDIDFD